MFSMLEMNHQSTPLYAFNTPTALPLKQEPLPYMSDRRLREPQDLCGDFKETFLAVTGYKTKISRLFS